MEESRFFSAIWRFNAIVIALAGVLAVVSLSLVAGTLYRDLTRASRDTGIVQAEGDDESGEKFRFGRLSPIPGAGTLALRLYADQKTGLKYSGSGATSMRNLLFIHQGSGEAHWLFPAHDRLVESWHQVPEEEGSGPDSPVIALLYFVVENDTNGDGRIDAGDKLTVGVSRPDGMGYRPVMRDLESVVGWERADGNQLMLVVRRNQSIRAIYMGLDDYKLNRDVALPAEPDKTKQE